MQHFQSQTGSSRKSKTFACGSSKTCVVLEAYNDLEDLTAIDDSIGGLEGVLLELGTPTRGLSARDFIGRPSTSRESISP